MNDQKTRIAEVCKPRDGSTAPAVRCKSPSAILKAKASAAGCVLTSIGDTKQLAGINLQSPAERRALWERFRHLYSGPGEVLIEAVMNHCAKIALKRLDRGEFSLIRTAY